MLLHKNFDGRKRVVVHQAPQLLRGTLHDDMLVNLIVAAGRIDAGDFLVAAQAVFEEAEIPIGKVGVFQPTPHEHEATIDPITRDGILRIANDETNFLFAFGRQRFIGIENENPFVTERQVLKRPVFFLRPSAVVVELHDLRAGGFRDGA